MKILMTAVLALALATGACSSNDRSAGSDSGGTTAKVMNTSDPDVVKIAVPTMQCEGCAATISKALKTLPEAKDVDVDVETKSVFVRVSNNTPEVKKDLETAISKSGYDTETMKADPVAYEQLEECCKVGGMDKKN